MNLTDQGIINFLYAEVKSFMEQHGYAETLPNYYECLKLVVGSAGTVLEDSQSYLDDKLEKAASVGADPHFYLQGEG